MLRDRLGRIGCFVAGLALAPIASGAEPAAEIEVTGLGWWRNRELRLAIDRLAGDEARQPALDANAIEDAVFLVISTVAEQGYLAPQVRAHLTLTDGTLRTFSFDARLTALLPRPLTASAVKLEVEPGVRFTVETVTFSGLSVVPESEARLLFRPGSGLGLNPAERAYSPARLRRAIGALTDRLRQLGYAEAKVEAAAVDRNEQTGDVSLRLNVTEGPRHDVSDVTITVAAETEVDVHGAETSIHGPWTPLAQQDFEAELRRRFQRGGHTDVRIELEAEPGAATEGRRPVKVVARVDPGPRVTLTGVTFRGAERTRESVLQRRVYARPGEPLDPQALDAARYRLSQLGVFTNVDLAFDPPQGPARSAVFTVTEARPWEANLLGGYGSYERFRVGLELRQTNLFGRAHLSRLQLVQSTKSSRGEYAYTVPELFGERVDGTVRLFGFEREEPAFVRQEYGGSVILRRPLPWVRADANVGYTYQALRTQDNQLDTRAVDLESVTVASADVGLVRDRRDNPLRPRAGYRWFAQVEAAAKLLGGEVDYQRWELGATWHRRIGRDRWLHAGVSHGVVTTAGAENDRELPVNRRFFPGGDSSIRGYQAGEAAPRAEDGRFLGAKSFLLLNLEFEQTLTGNWSAVVFADALGTAVRLADYPFDERLVSVGAGVRYQTLVGPLRLEYGHNLRRRPNDLSGTWHFSVGFPF